MLNLLAYITKTFFLTALTLAFAIAPKDIKKVDTVYAWLKLSFSHRHSFHLVDPSPWPLLTAFSVLGLPVGFAMYFHGYDGGLGLIKLSALQVVGLLFAWWNDIIREGMLEGKHTERVAKGLRMGMILFIVSEVMFFFAFFLSFFYLAFNPSFYIGAVWPPKYMVILNAFEVPLLNTFVLLTSGATITWAHHALVLGHKVEAFSGLLATLVLSAYFIFLQYFEYTTAPFNISDGAYASIFYIMTGFHGIHVIIGSLFLLVCEGRLLYNHFTRERHLGFEFAAWYWHFVDVVWILLYLCLYCWGSY